MINGVPVSSQQIAIAEMINGEINYTFGKKRIDIALPDQMIAIEYDSWFWHGNQQDKDRKRAQELIDFGWRVLSIKSKHKVPSIKNVYEYLQKLNFTAYIELVLSDWGKGDIFV